VEKTAYENADGVIAVSESMKRDVHDLYGVPFDKIRVIYNGIDVDEFHYSPNPAVLSAYRINPSKPIVLFVGRITRQKGIMHLVNAIKYIDQNAQIVLCAGAPDTEEIGREMAKLVEQARGKSRNEIIWISRILPKDDLIALYSHASVFVCPSVYEPFGIINLEAMACETPVVASAVGGLPEVVVQGETGLLVPFEPIGSNNFEPRDPERFSRDLAAAVNGLLSNPVMLKTMAKNSRERVERYFSWPTIAQRTLGLYRYLLSQ
jgi:glycogen synthase